MHDSIEDARAGGATLAEAAAKYGLKVVTLPPIDSSGKDVDGKPVPDVPQRAWSRRPSPATSAWRTTRSSRPTTSYAWYDVTDKTDPHDRAALRGARPGGRGWKDEQRQKLLDTQADTIKDKLDGGGDIADRGARLRARRFRRPRQAHPRWRSRAADLSAAAIIDAFAGAKGHGCRRRRAAAVHQDRPAGRRRHGSALRPESRRSSRRRRPRSTGSSSTTSSPLTSPTCSTKTNVRYNDATLQQLLGGGTAAN